MSFRKDVVNAERNLQVQGAIPIFVCLLSHFLDALAAQAKSNAREALHSSFASTESEKSVSMLVQPCQLFRWSRPVGTASSAPTPCCRACDTHLITGVLAIYGENSWRDSSRSCCVGVA